MPHCRYGRLLRAASGAGALLAGSDVRRCRLQPARCCGLLPRAVWHTAGWGGCGVGCGWRSAARASLQAVCCQRGWRGRRSTAGCGRCFASGCGGSELPSARQCGLKQAWR